MRCFLSLSFGMTLICLSATALAQNSLLEQIEELHNPFAILEANPDLQAEELRVQKEKVIQKLENEKQSLQSVDVTLTQRYTEAVKKVNESETACVKIRKFMEPQTQVSSVTEVFEGGGQIVIRNENIITVNMVERSELSVQQQRRIEIVYEHPELGKFTATHGFMEIHKLREEWRQLVASGRSLPWEAGIPALPGFRVTHQWGTPEVRAITQPLKQEIREAYASRNIALAVKKELEMQKYAPTPKQKEQISDIQLRLIAELELRLSRPFSETEGTGSLAHLMDSRGLLKGDAKICGIAVKHLIRK